MEQGKEGRYTATVARLVKSSGLKNLISDMMGSVFYGRPIVTNQAVIRKKKEDDKRRMLETVQTQSIYDRYARVQQQQ